MKVVDRYRKMQREGSRRYAKMRQVMADCEFPRWGGIFPTVARAGKGRLGQSERASKSPAVDLIE